MEVEPSDISISSKCSFIPISKYEKFMDLVKNDVTDLQISFSDKSWSYSGSFIRVPESNIWVYQHPCCIRCSSVDFENFESVFPLFPQDPAVQFCSQDLLETFFNDILYMSVTSGECDSCKEPLGIGLITIPKASPILTLTFHT